MSRDDAAKNVRKARGANPFKVHGTSKSRLRLRNRLRAAKKRLALPIESKMVWNQNLLLILGDFDAGRINEMELTHRLDQLMSSWSLINGNHHYWEVLIRARVYD